MTASDSPDPPPRGRRLIILGGAAVAVLLLCCCGGVAAAALTWGDDVYHRVVGGPTATVDLYEAGRDGDLEFTVSRVECGVDRLGDEFVSQPAIGQFCLVEMTIRNVGDRPATFSDSLQRAYGADGVRFGADTGAGILANAQQQVFLNEINPGNQVTGVVVYDIPPDARIAELELHASEHSPGVRVRC
jgi:hypothetical protein